MRRFTSTAEAGRLAGLVNRQLDQWLHHGYVTITDPGTGHGSVRFWRPNEVADIIAIGGVVRQANDAGLRVMPDGIRDMWAARSLGLGWRVTLDTGKAEQ